MTTHLDYVTGRFVLSEHLVPAGNQQFYHIYDGDFILGETLIPGLGKNLFLDATLDLNFAKNLSLVDDVSGNNLVTFSRASTGTYVGSDGLIKIAAVDEPRFDHDPVTGESLGLLIEEARTNLIRHSEQFDNWTNASGVTANTSISPDGSQTADTIPQQSNSNNCVLRSISVSPGVTYTFSVYLKQGTSSTTGIQFIGGAAGINETILLDFDTESVDNGSVENAGNGWYRILKTVTAAGNANPSFRIGIGTGTVFVWGAQIEAGSFPTSYIPTTNATVARAADVASLTGTNFSSWYNQSEGTLFYKASAQSAGALVLFSSGSSPSSNPRINVNVISGSLGGGGRSQVNVSGTQFDTGNSATPSYSSGTPVKQASAFQADNFAHCFQGGTVITDNSGTMPSTISRMDIGRNWASIYTNSHISRIAYFPTRKSDEYLVELTQPN